MHKPQIGQIGVESFAFYQRTSYILSCCSMIMYFLHFCAGFPCGIRVRFHYWFEILLLFVRGMNEYCHKKLDRNDVLHHSAFVVGSLIVFNVPECARFGFLLSHMQCLHFPMVLWYTGCRRTGPRAKLNAGTQIFCKMSFPPTWIFCVAYRATIMLCSIAFSAGAVHSLCTAALCLIFIVTTSIDISWSGFFFSVLGYSRSLLSAISAVLGCVLGLFVLFTKHLQTENLVQYN